MMGGLDRDEGGDGIRVMHVQPLTLDLYGHADEEFGSAAKYFLTHMVAAQRRLGDRPTVHLLTSGRAKSIEVDGVPVSFHPCVQAPRFLGVRWRYARQLSPSMLGAIREEDTDVVHFHGCRSIHGMYALVTARARIKGIPVVAQDHGPRETGPFMRMAQRFALSRTEFVLPANAGSEEELAARGVPRPDLVQIPNGIDPELFRPSEEPRSGPHDPFRVLAVFRMWSDKDPTTMVGALEKFSRDHEVRLTHVGGGPLEGQVREALDDASIPAEFLGRIPQEELARLYRRSDALVLTSLREGFNQVTLEAMASGLPVVATDIDGIRDGVGDAGFLIEPGKAEAIAEALGALADEPGEWRRRREAGLRRASRFRWESIVERLHQVYSRALGRHDSPSGSDESGRHGAAGGRGSPTAGSGGP